MFEQDKKTFINTPFRCIIKICPNCHAMLHKGKEPLSLEELKKLLKHRF